ncbi:beta-ketoacyl synthase N-terminal-like domain-containing protein [Streptomyces sp. NPDC059002]|uniref:beta-ketoacyl synthase N-terminal-like domain-containing protein n=1 Tax=Streptomyces sp. NPDC059002 TaxID=3346690 RepID=UPI0036830A00
MGIVITEWDAVSPFGTGRDAFTEGLWSGARPSTAPDPAPDPARGPAPDPRACLVPGFSPKQALGAKGTRAMDRVTALAAVAVGRLLEGAGADPAPDAPEQTGLVLGTANGSLQSMTDFTRDSLEGARPFYVDPGRMPNTVMNCAAGQSAIRYGLRGPNATVAGGRAAGLLAMSYQRRLLSRGRARRVVCGAAEEYSVARSWLEHHARPEGTEPVLLGEGCAVVLGDGAPAGPALAELLAVRSQVYLGDDPSEAVRQVVLRTLAAAGVAPGEVWAVSPSRPPGPAGDREEASLAGLFDPAALDRLPPLPFGDTGAASAAFQLVSVLSALDRLPAAAGGAAVVSSVDREGTVACAVLRLGEPRSAARRSRD